MEEKKDPAAITEKFWLAAGALIALGAIAVPVLNPDLYWHLSAGKYIVRHLSLPSSDFLSWSQAGAPWTDFEWLAQLLYYGIFSVAGTAGIFTLKMAVLAATFPVFYAVLALNGLKRAAFFALPLWGLALMANSDLRPENFSVLFFAVLLWRLEAARLVGRFPSGARAYVLLALFFALWANLHAGFAYGLLLLGAYAAGDMAGRKLWHSGGKAPGPGPALGLLAAAGGTLLNPWGVKLYSILFQHVAEAGPLTRYLAEWAPPSLLNPWHLPFMFFLFVSFLLMLKIFLKDRALPPAQLFTLGVLAFEASRHTRHIVFFCMAAAVYSVSAAARLWEPGTLRRAGRWLFVLTFGYLCLAVWPRYLAFKVNLGEEAAGAASYLKANKNLLGGRKLYNPWTWGGYLGWALNPDYKVFTDGRYIFHKYLEPVSAAMADQDAWENYAVKQGFELVLFRRDRHHVLLPQTVRKDIKRDILRPAYLVFMPEDKWALVYWDAFSLLFARRGKPLPAEFKIIRPDDLENVEFAMCAGAVSSNAARAELALYRAAPGAPSKIEGGRFAGWLAGFPASCKR